MTTVKEMYAEKYQRIFNSLNENVGVRGETLEASLFRAICSSDFIGDIVLRISKMGKGNQSIESARAEHTRTTWIACPQQSSIGR